MAGVNRALLIAVIGAAVLAATLVLNLYILPGPNEAGRQAGEPPPGQGTAGGGAPGGGFIGLPTPKRTEPNDFRAPKMVGRGRLPTFDIVRISPDGNAVIAGRAVPGAEVTVLDGGKPIGKVIADARGEWVLVPARPLGAGARKLSLRAKLPDGTVLESAAEVVLVVPEPGRDVAGRKVDGPRGAIALRVPKSPPGKARAGLQRTTVLQRPAGRGRVKGRKGEKGALSVDSIDYDARGRVWIGGTASPGARVRIYLDNKPLGDAVADSRGRWSFQPQKPLKPGSYRLRADELDTGGRVARRIEIPFSRAEHIVDLPAGGIAVVQPGNSLWRIARGTYGSGLQYTVIYEANKDQIRDPDLIYPGQIFTLPKRAPVN